MNPTCELDLHRIQASAEKLGKLLIDIFTDIGSAVPDQKEVMSALSDATAVNLTNLTSVTLSAIVLDEASNIFLKQFVIQNGFGKLLKCNGQDVPSSQPH